MSQPTTSSLQSQPPAFDPTKRGGNNIGVRKSQQQHQERPKSISFDLASVSHASETGIVVPHANGSQRLTGRQLHDMAKAALSQGDYPKALSMFQSILQAQHQRFGRDHPSVGAAMHNVGVVQLRMGQPEQAQVILEEAAAIRREMLGPNDMEVAATLAKLSAAQSQVKQWDGAVENVRESLRIMRSIVGNEHVMVAQTLSQMACLYFEAGELLAAQATFSDALYIYRIVLEQQQPSASPEMERNGNTSMNNNIINSNSHNNNLSQLAETLCNLGSIQNKRKNHVSAIASFSEALEVRCNEFRN
jgi:tetratricopeptide (TPR) repeat protein